VTKVISDTFYKSYKLTLSNAQDSAITGLLPSLWVQQPMRLIMFLCSLPIDFMISISPSKSANSVALAPSDRHQTITAHNCQLQFNNKTILSTRWSKERISDQSRSCSTTAAYGLLHC